MKPIAFGIGELLGRLFPMTFYEKLLSHSVLQHDFSVLKRAPTYATREDLWASAVKHIGANEKVLFLEFGVWQGYSINYFSKAFDCEGSRFYGFDSFEGLPENWEGNSAGTFSTRGKRPNIADSRVSFIDGWFQNSVPAFLNGLKLDERVQVFAHFDADLYSSTLFVLEALSRCIDRYYFVFDEFPGDETRALHNFLQANGSTVTFMGRTGRAMQVFGFLESSNPYSPSALRIQLGYGQGRGRSSMLVGESAR